VISWFSQVSVAPHFSSKAIAYDRVTSFTPHDTRYSIMSYHQIGGNIIHLPASTHTSYSGQGHHGHHEQHGTSAIASTNSVRIMNYGTTTTTMHSTTALNSTTTTSTPIMMASTMTDSGNLSLLESHPSLLEAGELLMNPVPVVANNNNSGGSSSINASHRRGKPDIAIFLSLLSFFVWLRLLQTMFYQSTLGQFGGIVKELLCVFLVWIPSVTLTCFYFRSDDYHHQHQRRYFRSWGR
jgi:hypothetical protein